MKRSLAFPVSVLFGLNILFNTSIVSAAAPSRQAEVSVRGANVMPFELKATTHLFSKKKDGGVQQVVAKNPKDQTQIRLIREHLKQIAVQFTKGDFSGPIHIHGSSMPGLNDLKRAKSGEIRVSYQNLSDGGQIEYTTANAPLIAALHQWFDAQLSDHGADAKEGHQH